MCTRMRNGKCQGKHARVSIEAQTFSSPIAGRHAGVQQSVRGGEQRRVGLAWKLLSPMANLYQGCAAGPKAGLLGSPQLRAMKRLRPKPAGRWCTIIFFWSASTGPDAPTTGGHWICVLVLYMYSYCNSYGNSCNSCADVRKST